MAAWHYYFNAIFKTSSYVCLLACGLFFSKDAIKQYLDGKTALQITQEKLPLEDLPVVTICFENYYDLFCDNIDKKLDWNVTYSWAIKTGQQDYDEVKMADDTEVSYR